VTFGSDRWRLWVGNRWEWQASGVALRYEVLGGNRPPLGDQESVGRDAESSVMMEASPSAPFIMPEPEFLLEFLVIALDAPAQLGEGTGAKASDNSEAPQRATASRLVSTILRV